MSHERKHTTPPEKTTPPNRDARKDRDDNERKNSANASGSPARDASTIEDGGCGCGGVEGIDKGKKRSTQSHSGEVPGRDDQD